ncbi:hypothetical protein GCM10025870_30990 [Agromyces marinus]|uniref:Tyrosine specific protein phosphatases domain-containing protein n=1 Tax=Agromyces marinus TaxID=1389020 RepID=A0ABN6YJ32_9MICO|nr:tyrosine-protein phosphatase [Agromyces marinus]BDZ56026.1 hypothetical protein GCM10025870_30990 [Agromyces marinus]
MEISTRIPVPGTYNFRDVGGLPARGGSVRYGRLFRSDGLHRLGEEGRDALRRLEVGVVVDLRDENESRLMPDDISGLEIEVLQLPVFEGSGASQGERGISLDELYHRILTRHAGVVVQVLREISSAGDRAVVVHCTAGKDRTGIVVALALLAAGVDRESVIADYVVTESLLAGSGSRRWSRSSAGTASPTLPSCAPSWAEARVRRSSPRSTRSSGGTARCASSSSHRASTTPSCGRWSPGSSSATERARLTAC